MRKSIVLASLILLLILQYHIVVEAGSTIGPGINTSESWTAPNDINVWTVEAVFTTSSDQYGYYNFYIALKNDYDSKDHWVYVELIDDSTGSTIASNNITVPGGTGLTSYLVLENVSITANTVYRLRIVLDKMIGIMLYTEDKDPSIHLFINGVQHDEYELAFLGVPVDIVAPSPEAILLSHTETINDDGVIVRLELELKNWKPSSEVEIHLEESWYSDMAIVTVDENGSWNGTIIFRVKMIEEGTKIYVRGYDQNGVYHRIEIIVYNETLVPPTWLDLVRQYVQAIISYASLIFTVVVAVIPYAGSLWVLALLSSIIACIKEWSIKPLFDFFYKNYTALISLANLLLKVAEKLYQGAKFLIDILTRIAETIIMLIK
ncbi:hypothetical protein J4526_01450 [Desulfurococcaceae archaeon MEX13E-LK6-19]|nr:hypothetical protein J4526_01450 [Desulfurococcaceae archaeon MEX13E-LK6-19]